MSWFMVASKRFVVRDRRRFNKTFLVNVTQRIDDIRRQNETRSKENKKFNRDIPHNDVDSIAVLF